MIVQNSAVQKGQWLSFLWCYVVCEMEKIICPRPRLKFILNSIKKCVCTNETAAHNLCNERLRVLAKGYLWTVFFRSSVMKLIGLFKKGGRVQKSFFIEKPNKTMSFLRSDTTHIKKHQKIHTTHIKKEIAKHKFFILRSKVSDQQ